MGETVTREALKGFLDAFNRHDLDAIMSYFADDCVVYMPRGAKPRGDRFESKEAVRAGLARRFEGIPDVRYGDDRHWVCFDSVCDGIVVGVSEWTLTGTSTAGARMPRSRILDIDALLGKAPCPALNSQQSRASMWNATSGLCLRRRPMCSPVTPTPRWRMWRRRRT
ncbi:nuclear transport factor 2 family protein [Cryobacterium cryoconiti]|uniref:Nuclear transport factor 2 family protein n=2 Tax=Cryobacterium cryoconiti TaxID=1259239 RepID=A0A4Y8JUC0_9MICO|nr:nuclear transport factor 2 family protein [Cryobacterium cryoconiti]